MRNFIGVSTGRERLLSAVKHHKHHLTVVGDTHAGAGSARVVVIACVCDGDLPVLYQPYMSADSFLYVVLVRLPLVAAADDGSAVVENGEECPAVTAVILHAPHDKRTGRTAVAHIVEVCVHTKHSVVIRNVIFRIVRIGMLLLRGVHLIGHAGHSQDRAVVVIVVCIYADVTAGDVYRGDIVNDLFIVLCQRHFYFLRNAGGKCRGAG